MKISCHIPRAAVYTIEKLYLYILHMTALLHYRLVNLFGLVPVIQKNQRLKLLSGSSMTILLFDYMYPLFLLIEAPAARRGLPTFYCPTFVHCIH